MVAIKKKRKAFVEQSDCIACGCCVKVCPIGVIQIIKGIMAQVDMGKCVGCGKCAKECPATVQCPPRRTRRLSDVEAGAVLPSIYHRKPPTPSPCGRMLPSCQRG